VAPAEAEAEALSAQADVLDHKEEQAGLAARRLAAQEAALEALRGGLARAAAARAALAVGRARERCLRLPGGARSSACMSRGGWRPGHAVKRPRGGGRAAPVPG